MSTRSLLGLIWLAGWTVVRAGEKGESPPAWPLPPQLHPVVVNMPERAERSIQSLADYITEQEPNPFGRVKAFHDWVCTKIEYAMREYRAGTISQDLADPRVVFRTRRAVCAGFANLMKALGEASDLEIVYVKGRIRAKKKPRSSRLEVGPHAWNAVKIRGRWHLIDVTWDAGYTPGEKFIKRYRTDYLFGPPSVFVSSHFPDNARFQLLEQPITFEQFRNQAKLRPAFFDQGWVLKHPKQYEIEAHGRVRILLGNPNQAVLLGIAFADNGKFSMCKKSGTDPVLVTCDLPLEATYRLNLSARKANSPEKTLHPKIADFKIINRPPERSR